ncbi:hypothetical protein C7212DRAFT_160254 [Tuber magnatum]|uniref:Uncharacterized protein n=1 Tax=Tuber magnatum TaxID=42249 RepID=A0A317T223_9PEZI|nr:hypothetical protein C7212DRAFT_162218 [Tuber magnatum]PWW80742.1 hypothetical protein C7212DRAFT_160254 [Tuber magnatum]
MLIPPEWKKFCRLVWMASRMGGLSGRRGEGGVFAMRNSSSMPIVIIEEVLSFWRAFAVWCIPAREVREGVELGLIVLEVWGE